MIDLRSSCRDVTVLASAAASRGGVMIKTGTQAPDFSLHDQFARKISLEQFRGKRHVMLFFYPLDFTAT